MTSDILKRLQGKTPSEAWLGTIRSCVGIIGLTVVLWANASDFDATEWNAIMLMAVVFGGAEAVSAVLKSVMKGG